MSAQNYITQNADIREICQRLKNSLKEANAKNKELEEKERAENEQGHFSKRKKFRHTPEHANISEYFKNNRWEKTISLPKSGDAAFIAMFTELVNLRGPEAIKVEIFNGKGEKRALPIWEKEIWLIGEPKTPQVEGNLGAVVSDALREMKETIAQVKTQAPENGGVSNSSLEIIQKDFEMRLERIQHENQINTLKQEHAGELKELKRTIAELNDEISDLNDELDEYESGLDGVEKQVKEIKDPPFVSVLSKVVERAGEGLLRSNPKILKLGLKMTDKEIEELWKDEPQAISQTNDASSFSETADEYAGLDPKHVEGIKQVIGLMKAMPLKVFMKFHWVMSKLQKEDGTANEGIIDQLCRLFTPEKKQPEAQPQESQETETV